MFSNGKSDVYHGIRTRGSRSRRVAALFIFAMVIAISVPAVLISAWRPHSSSALRQLEIRLVTTHSKEE